MTWPDVLIALIGIVGVVIGVLLTTRLGRYETYFEWRRNRLFELYTELVPVLYRIRGLMAQNRSDVDQTVLGPVFTDLVGLIPRVEILCSEEARASINHLYGILSSVDAPWYVQGDDRLQYKQKRPLGSQAATFRHVESAMAAIQNDLKSADIQRMTWRNIPRVLKLQREAPKKPEPKPVR
jgi:hypothetical protein